MTFWRIESVVPYQNRIGKNAQLWQSNHVRFKQIHLPESFVRNKMKCEIDEILFVLSVAASHSVETYSQYLYGRQIQTCVRIVHTENSDCCKKATLINTIEVPWIRNEGIKKMLRYEQFKLKE